MGKRSAARRSFLSFSSFTAAPDCIPVQFMFVFSPHTDCALGRKRTIAESYQFEVVPASKRLVLRLQSFAFIPWKDWAYVREWPLDARRSAAPRRGLLARKIAFPLKIPVNTPYRAAHPRIYEHAGIRRHTPIASSIR